MLILFYFNQILTAFNKLHNLQLVEGGQYSVEVVQPLT
jgi:hypothetical protein